MEARQQIEELKYMTTGQLREKYREVFGEASSRNCGRFLLPAGSSWTPCDTTMVGSF